MFSCNSFPVRKPNLAVEQALSPPANKLCKKALLQMQLQLVYSCVVVMLARLQFILSCNFAELDQNPCAVSSLSVGYSGRLYALLRPPVNKSYTPVVYDDKIYIFRYM